MAERGFTVIELILVIVVMAVLAAVIGLNLSSLDAIKASGAARRLASDIRFAQQMSVTQQNIHGVAFNVPVVQQYTVYEQNDPNNPARNPQGGNDFIVSFVTGEFEGVTIATSFPGGRVGFNSRGEPLDGAGSPVAPPNNTVTLTYQSTAATVTVTPLTGKLTY